MPVIKGFWRNFRRAWRDSKMRECVRKFLNHFYQHHFPESPDSQTFKPEKKDDQTK